MPGLKGVQPEGLRKYRETKKAKKEAAAERMRKMHEASKYNFRYIKN